MPAEWWTCRPQLNKSLYILVPNPAFTKSSFDCTQKKSVCVSVGAVKTRVLVSVTLLAKQLSSSHDNLPVCKKSTRLANYRLKCVTKCTICMFGIIGGVGISWHFLWLTRTDKDAWIPASTTLSLTVPVMDILRNAPTFSASRGSISPMNPTRRWGICDFSFEKIACQASNFA